MTLGPLFRGVEGEDVSEEMDALEALLKEECEWELEDEFGRRRMLDLEDGERVGMEMEEVEGMDGEDEGGEYALVVVDLDNVWKIL